MLFANIDEIIDGKEDPTTNENSIRTTSAEKLADNRIRDFAACHQCAYRYECERDEWVTYEKCREGIEEWLKQHAEGENNGSDNDGLANEARLV